MTSYQLPPARRWRQQAFPIPVVVNLIHRPLENQYLLIRRNKEPYIGRWGLVGGKWDFGETLASVATREVKEETSLDTTFVALRGVVNERVAPAGLEDTAGHFLIFICELLPGAGEASEQAEGAVAWFTPAEIDQLHQQAQVIPSDYLMLKQFSDPATSALDLYEAEMRAAAGGGEVTLLRFDTNHVP
jgi:ADP-ribose pyrophosphatase YjhB (NUDIX family)